ncbi:MAG: T9SS type A sorting domain-containing protein [Bacteroidota bacterium]
MTWYPMGIGIGILLTFAPLFAQVNLNIQPSANSGIAPLYVFFDATTTTGLSDTNDLVNSDFQWNFDLTDTDPNGNWIITKGMVAGHAFEEPGTYIVQCTVTAPDGTTDTETDTIMVTAFSGTTYYVAANGNDANNGLSMGTPWQTANFAFTQLGPNERVLFQRGDTFPNVAYDFNNLTVGRRIIGAYGTGDKPILTGTIDQDVFFLDQTDNIAFMDLHVVANSSTAGVSNFNIEDCENILLLNLELEGATSLAIYYDDVDKSGTFDTYVHDFGVLAVFSGDGTRMSWVGNRIDSLIGTPQPEHGMRIQRGEKQFIAHNTLTNLIETKSSIQIRGDGQRHVMIYRNKMDRILGVNPQNVATVAAISHVTIEGNYIGQNPAYTGTSWENSNNGINVEATNIAIRNNVIDGYRNAIFVGHDFNGVVSGMVDVYHNTANWRAVSSQSGTGGRMVRVRDVSHVNIRNNFISAPSLAQASTVNVDATSTFIDQAHNIIATTADYVLNPLPGSAAESNDISNYQVLSSSGAIGAGGSGVPVFYDVDNRPRNLMTPDVGAFESPTFLPVELLTFEAFPQRRSVLLRWTTALEVNSDNVEIQRTENGLTFEKIGRIEATGNQTTMAVRQFTDFQPLQNNYYRLKMVDKDGSFDYSRVVHAEMPINVSFSLYPNPTKGKVVLQPSGTGGEGVFELYDTHGIQVFHHTIYNRQAIDIPDWPSGLYHWRFFQDGALVNTGKLVKL